MLKKFSILCITLFIFLGTCLPVFATSLDDYYIFNTKYSKPSVTGNTGYVEVLLRNKNTNVHYMRMYYWALQTRSESTIEPYVAIQSDGDSLTLSPRGFYGSGNGWSLFCIKPLNDTLELIACGPYTDSISISVDDNSSALEVVTFRAYGNYNFYGQPGSVDNDTPFIVNYGDDINVTFDAMLQELKDIDLKIGIISNILSNHGMTFELIASYLLDIGLTLDEIYELLLNSSNSEVTEESSNSNEVLDDVITEYEDIEGGFVTNFEDSIGNLPSIDFNAYDDFAPTVQFVSNTMQQIYDSNQYLRLLINACLLIGIALLLIGRGNKK